MNNFRKRFLSTSTFSGDQNGQIRCGYLHGYIDRMIEGRGIPYDTKVILYSLYFRSVHNQTISFQTKKLNYLFLYDFAKEGGSRTIRYQHIYVFSFLKIFAREYNYFILIIPTLQKFFRTFRLPFNQNFVYFPNCFLISFEGKLLL